MNALTPAQKNALKIALSFGFVYSRGLGTEAAKINGTVRKNLIEGKLFRSTGFGRAELTESGRAVAVTL